MVAHSDQFKGVQFGKFDTYEELHKSMQKHVKENLNDVIFVCVGSDRSTGDSLAPLVGTYLYEKGYENVVGTIDNPVHAVNLEETIESLPKDKTVIAIDASLGRLKSVGKYTFNSGALLAGRGVGKSLPPVGDYHITGIVNLSGYQEYFVLMNTRLSLVMKMARNITKAIEITFPLQKDKDIKLVK